MVAVHRHGFIVYMNPCALRMLGYESLDQVVGVPAIEFVHPDDHRRVIERIRSTTKGVSMPTVEERFLHRDGITVVVVEVSAMPTVFEGEPAVIVIGREITERRAIEAKLIMNDRLASLGRLAASVGHEINNPIAYVLGNIGMMRRQLEGAPGIEEAARAELLERLGVISEGANRVREIVQDLKRLSRGDDAQIGPVEINRVLDVCANLAENEITQRARFVRRYDQPTFANVNEARLGQVILNLLVNAAQAIPPGHVADNEVVLSTQRLPNNEVAIEVTDTGEGIPKSELDRIFEPFFTTKAPGAGTGLGLSICHHIVTQFGGTIKAVRLEELDPPMRGTILRVVVPTCEG
jgi:PAS domain S-box-containing protein